MISVSKKLSPTAATRATTSPGPEVWTDAPDWTECGTAGDCRNAGAGGARAAAGQACRRDPLRQGADAARAIRRLGRLHGHPGRQQDLLCHRQAEGGEDRAAGA